MTEITTLDIPTNRIGYAERPFRREPGGDVPDSDIYQATPEERAAVMQAAIDAGITFFHAAYEREAASLGASIRALGARERIIVSTTDGDVLDRCPDTEEGAAQAVAAAIKRKQGLLGVEVIDAFSLYDVRRDVHTPARVAGARRALADAQAAGTVKWLGATCYEDYEALAGIIETGALPLGFVQARYNYADQRAAERLFPACRSHDVRTLAAQTFSWHGGIPFVRFPNTWRFRNLTKNFYGFTAAQAHLYWVLQNASIDGVVISMQTPEQIAENMAAARIEKAPTGLESLSPRSWRRSRPRARAGAACSRMSNGNTAPPPRLSFTVEADPDGVSPTPSGTPDPIGIAECPECA